MALNSFFLNGSPSEQRLVQDLINEQLRMYGVEVLYVPRRFVRKETIIREVTTSKFSDNYAIEAYLTNYDGYSGAGDILTKFGMNLRDELTLIISKERFDDFISPFMANDTTGELEVVSRPREGDIIYFPLGKRIFEVKFVEHEQPFYQLGKTYVYELKCELFEYEDEIGGWGEINQDTSDIDETLENQGYIKSLQLFSSGQVPTLTPSISTGYVRKIYLNNDGYDYTGTPTVAISSAPSGGTNATAIALTKCTMGSCSVKEILITNAGAGYTTIPIITITGGNGVGAAATCEIVKNYYGIRSVSIASSGSGYSTPPSIRFSNPSVGSAITATGKVVVSPDGNISKVYISDAGIGYTTNPTIDVDNPPLIVGIGTYTFNEIVVGQTSKTRARVKTWNEDAYILKVGITTGLFIPGEIIVGTSSSAIYSLKSLSTSTLIDNYEQNDEFESEASAIVDFSESNPFGNY
jgi:hypothetical protein